MKKKKLHLSSRAIDCPSTRTSARSGCPYYLRRVVNRLFVLSTTIYALNGDIPITEKEISNLPLYSSVDNKNKKTNTDNFLKNIGLQIQKNLKQNKANGQKTPQKQTSECPNTFIQHSLSNVYKHPEINCKKITLRLSSSANIFETIKLINKLANLDITVDQNIHGSFGRQEFKDKTVGQILMNLLPYHSPALALIKNTAGFQITEESKARDILAKTKDQISTLCFELECADPSEKLKEEIYSFWKITIGNDKCAEISMNNTKIFARGRAHQLSKLKEFLENIDTQTTQVKIDLVIASTDKQFGLDFGINWSGIYNRHKTIVENNTSFALAGLGGVVDDIPEPTKPLSKRLGDLFVNPANLGVNLSNNIFSNLLNASLGGNTITVPIVFGGPDLNLARLNLIINAEEAEYKLKVFQRPTMVTLDKETVTISLGRSIPIITNIQDSSESTIRMLSTFNYRDIGVNISVTPVISPDKKSVSLDLLIESSELSSGSTRVTPGGIQTDPPVFEMLKMKNRIQLNNQQTAIIGGLSRNLNITSKRNVPIISQLPVVGALFRSTSNAEQKTETFIFITPTIITG